MRWLMLLFTFLMTWKFRRFEQFINKINSKSQYILLSDKRAKIWQKENISLNINICKTHPLSRYSARVERNRCYPLAICHEPLGRRLYLTLSVSGRVVVWMTYLITSVMVARRLGGCIFEWVNGCECILGVGLITVWRR